MSEKRQRIDPVTAEHLVRDARAATDSDPLARLLAAATTPARPHELAGEEDAVRAFRAANLARPTTSRRRSTLAGVLARRATAKIAVAVIAVSGGGIALAAGTGHLPGVSGPNHHSTAHPATSVPTTPQPSGPGSARTSGGSGLQDGSTGPGRPSNSATRTAGPPNGSPAPNLRGLCTAYTAQARDNPGNPGHALDNPAFGALVDAAGGKDRVASYCSALLGAQPTKPSRHAGGGQATHGSPATHPTGAPGHDHPSSSPHPSGPPSHPHRLV